MTSPHLSSCSSRLILTNIPTLSLGRKLGLSLQWTSVARLWLLEPLELRWTIAKTWRQIILATRSYFCSNDSKACKTTVILGKFTVKAKPECWLSFFLPLHMHIITSDKLSVLGVIIWIYWTAFFYKVKKVFIFGFHRLAKPCSESLCFFGKTSLLSAFVPKGLIFSHKDGESLFTSASDFYICSAESTVCLVFIKGSLKAQSAEDS